MALNGEQFLLKGAGLWALALAAAALMQPRRNAASWSFAAGMIILALDALLLGGATVVADAPWAQLAMTAAVPAPWLAFSLCYARGNSTAFLRAWKITLIASAFLPIGAILAWYLTARFADPNLAFPAINSQLAVQRDWLEPVLHLAMLVASVLVLMNLERTFRASVGTLRWRIKFVMIGLGLVFAARFYSSSQSVLYAASIPDGGMPVSGLTIINAGALLLGCILITVSFFRAPLTGVEVYPTRTALEASLTIVLAGAYLVVVGVFAKVVAFLGGDAAFPLKALVALLLVVTVGLVLASDRARLFWRRFLSRHLHRSFYDYRGLWRNFTERTRTIVDEPAYARELAALISDAAQTLSVSIWIERMGKLTLAASTSLSAEGGRTGMVNSGSPELPMPSAAAELKLAEPFALEDSSEPWVEGLKASNPDLFQKGGKRVCVPLLASELSMTTGGTLAPGPYKELLGLLIIGDRVNGIAFSLEDFELFKSLAAQAASGLLNLRLTRQLVQARELEAFQTMSAFLVHDLKNTASTLSLMLGNLPTHFDDPQFRADALQAISKSVGRINDLISRLTVLRHKPELQQTDTDLNEAVKATLADFKGQDIACELRPLPKVAIDAEQMGKVLTNLVLNARDAAGPSGLIRVTTNQRDRWAVLSVEDNGCGMSQEFISRSLFRPFQTTKKKGIGIGMFHSKMIVDAHGGRIEVESEVNQGTTFRVLLPVKE